MKRYLFLLLASILSFIIGALATAFYMQPKVTLEAIVKTITWPMNVIPEYLAGATTSFVEWYTRVTSEPHLAVAFGLLTVFSACVMAFAAWRLALISRGFRKAVLYAGGGYVATALALVGLSGEFRKAKIILVPLAAILFVFVLVGLWLMRLNEKWEERAAHPRRTRAQKPERARRLSKKE